MDAIVELERERGRVRSGNVRVNEKELKAKQLDLPQQRRRTNGDTHEGESHTAIVDRITVIINLFFLLNFQNLFEPGN